MTPDTIYELKNEILDLVDIIAEAVVKKLRPAAAEITRRQAWDEFDRTWLEDQISRNRIKGRRTGPPKNAPTMFSRAELLALKEAERRGARMVRRDMR